MQLPRHTTENAADRRARTLAALTDLGFRPSSLPAPVEAGRIGEDWRVTQVVAAMGTRVAITAVDASRDRCEAAIGAAWGRMDALIAMLSRHDDSSALAVLNDQRRLSAPPPELLTVLTAARQLHEHTHGTFDPTVLPVIELLEAAGNAGGFIVPTNAALAAALERVDGSAIDIRAEELRLEHDGVRVTLDGIAKGYIVDAIAETLQSRGIDNYLIDAGGDIRTAGSNAGAPWRVAVREPGVETSIEVLTQHEGAIATSGSYEIAYDDARDWHHLVRTEDGRCAAECASVTVLAPDAMSADALATTTFLLGPVHGPRLIDSLDGCECLVVSRDGTRSRSRGWASTPGDAGTRRNQG